jgi:predicted transcriptional regulator
MCGRELGASVTELAELLNLAPSVVSRRYDAAKLSLVTDGKLNMRKRWQTGYTVKNCEN